MSPRAPWSVTCAALSAAVRPSVAVAPSVSFLAVGREQPATRTTDNSNNKNIAVDFMPRAAAFIPRAAAFTSRAAAFIPRAAAFTPRAAGFMQPCAVAFTPRAAVFIKPAISIILHITPFLFVISFYILSFSPSRVCISRRACAYIYMSCHHSPLASPLQPFGVATTALWRGETALLALPNGPYEKPLIFKGKSDK